MRLPKNFASLPREERVELVLSMDKGPSCIAGCGRPVAVHGETCRWCWRD